MFSWFGKTEKHREKLKHIELNLQERARDYGRYGRLINNQYRKSQENGEDISWKKIAYQQLVSVPGGYEEADLPHCVEAVYMVAFQAQYIKKIINGKEGQDRVAAYLEESGGNPVVEAFTADYENGIYWFYEKNDKARDGTSADVKHVMFSLDGVSAAGTNNGMILPYRLPGVEGTEKEQIEASRVFGLHFACFDLNEYLRWDSDNACWRLIHDSGKIIKFDSKKKGKKAGDVIYREIIIIWTPMKVLRHEP